MRRALLAMIFSTSLATAGPIQVTVQVPVNPQIDSSKYDYILVMNFRNLGGTTEKFDLNDETVKFLRNELKGKIGTKVLEPAELPAVEGAPDSIFKDTEYWRHIGALFPGTLIISGTVELKAERRSGFQDEEVITPSGAPVRVQRYKEAKFFVLGLDLYYIDGSTGESLHHEELREEMVYDNPDQPALYGYYDLMDRIMPRFLGAVVSQKYQEVRYLLE